MDQNKKPNGDASTARKPPNRKTTDDKETKVVHFTRDSKFANLGRKSGEETPIFHSNLTGHPKQRVSGNMNLTGLVYKDPVKKQKKKQTKNGYFSWFLTYGKALFLAKYGVDYIEYRTDHQKQITALWNEAKAAEDGLDEAGKRMAAAAGILPVSSLTPHPKARPAPIRLPNKIRFKRHDLSELEKRSSKTFAHLYLKFLTTAESTMFPVDALPGLPFFVLNAHEYYSNARGDRVAPAEVTLLEFSLNEGMRTLLSKVVLFNQSIVTDDRELDEGELSTILESYEQTGIPADRPITNEENPEGVDVISVDELKRILIYLLSKTGSEFAPIVVLKSNYNEVAGMLITLFPDHWENLKARFCFLDDLFRFCTLIENGKYETPPVCDDSDLPLPTPCSFHFNLITNGMDDKKCTQQAAIRGLQILFKNLCDANVLGMQESYEPVKHRICNKEKWDTGSWQVEWEEEEKIQKKKVDDWKGLSGYVSSGSQDNSLDEWEEPDIDSINSIFYQREFSTLERNQNNNNNDGRSSDNSVNRYGDGFVVRDEYGSREAAREKKGQRNDSGINDRGSSVFNGGGGVDRFGNDERGRKIRDRSSSPLGKQFSGLAIKEDPRMSSPPPRDCRVQRQKNHPHDSIFGSSSRDHGSSSNKGFFTRGVMPTVPVHKGQSKETHADLQKSADDEMIKTLPRHIYDFDMKQLPGQKNQGISHTSGDASLIQTGRIGRSAPVQEYPSSGNGINNGFFNRGIMPTANPLPMNKE